jgi:lipoate-protein ligase A
MSKSIQKWRLIDTGINSAAENLTLDETILDAMVANKTLNTLRFLQFSQPAVLIGYHQSLKQEARINYCFKNNIEINRRLTGGGAIYLDENQLGWEVIARKKDLGGKKPFQYYFKLFCECAISGLKELGINAGFRGKNDIEIDGRKISGTGGLEKDGIIFFQGTLLIDLDPEKMIKSLRIPVEKLQAHEIEELKDRITCLKWELGRLPDVVEIKKALADGFKNYLNIDFEFSGLTDFEKALFEKKSAKFKSKEWLFLTDEPKEDQPILKASIRKKGGLIRAAIVYSRKYNRIQQAKISGDFFIHPRRAISDFEIDLKGIDAEEDSIEKTTSDFFYRNKVKMLNLKSRDFNDVIWRAVKKSAYFDCGINQDEVNHIFTVNGELKNIISPKKLLLPYCAKPLSCPYRYSEGCIECGECSMGDAYRIAGENCLEPITVLNYRHLQFCLKEISENKDRSFIGCCCEAFFIKHRKDFEKSGIPGVLINLEDSTCYDLGEQLKAKEGIFEGETKLKTGLLEKIIGIVRENIKESCEYAAKV